MNGQNYFDKLPAELLAEILSKAACRNDLNPFELQKQRCHQNSVNQRFRAIGAGSGEYAVKSRFQLGTLTKWLEADEGRGRDARVLVVDMSGQTGKAKGTHERGKQVLKLLKLLPNLVELELHDVQVQRYGRGRTPDMQGSLGDVGIELWRTLRGLHAIQSFAYFHTKHANLITGFFSNANVVEMFAAWKDLAQLHLPRVGRSPAQHGAVVGTIKPSSSFRQLSIVVENELDQLQVQTILDSTKKTLTHLGITNVHQLNLETILDTPLVNLRHLSWLGNVASNYLDKARFLNLESLELGIMGYRDFAFVGNLVKLHHLEIRVPFLGPSGEHPNYINPEGVRVNCLLADLETRLSIRGGIRFIRVTRYWYPLSDGNGNIQQLELGLLSATCVRLGIKFEVVDF